MKEHKMSRRNFLKVGAVASAAGLMTAAPVAANAALLYEKGSYKDCRSGCFHRS